MAKKLPALHFYPGDWFKDPGIMALNCEERGAWFQILLLMFESGRRGYLELNKKPFPQAKLAQILGLSEKKLIKVLLKLTDYGVISLSKDVGIFYSKRMVEDEENRQVLVKAGESGGRGNKKEKAPPLQKKKGVPEDEVEDENESEKGLLNNEQKKAEFEKRWKVYLGEKDGKKLALGYWNASIKKPEDLDRYDQAELNYYKIVGEDRKNGFACRRYKAAKTWFNNWESYVDQKPPPKKTADGIPAARDLDKDELKAKIWKGMEFVKGEVSEGKFDFGNITASGWLRLAVGRSIMEFEQRFGEDPLNEEKREFYDDLAAEYKMQDEQISDANG
jgi:hypothetical protein